MSKSIKSVIDKYTKTASAEEVYIHIHNDDYDDLMEELDGRRLDYSDVASYYADHQTVTVYVPRRWVGMMPEIAERYNGTIISDDEINDYL